MDSINCVPLVSESESTAKLRRDSFVRAIPHELNIKMAEIRRKLKSKNASVKDQLNKIYSLLSELSEVERPYVACGEGCSGCCKMNVLIYEIEAKNIESFTGIKPRTVSGHARHPIEEFLGVPCPFLKEGNCSIYEVRPFVCRWHVSFDTSPYWCDPGRTQEMTFPLVHFVELERALNDIAAGKGGLTIADIRDYFPNV